MSVGTTAAYDVRPYRDDDLEAVLDLLSRAMGGGPTGRRSAAFFRWKHLENPFGRSYMILGVSGERVIGLRAFLRWGFDAPHGPVRAVRAVDTATHPDFQGRGVFTRLTLAALEDLRSEADLVFNTPNEKSMPGYLKMGWKVAGRLPIRLLVRRPLRALRSLVKAGGDPRIVDHPGGRAAADVLGRAAALAARWPAPSGLRTPRTEEVLRWRYAAPPGLDYRAVDAESGTAIFRVRGRRGAREASAAEAITVPGDRRGLRVLLRMVGREASADHVSVLPAGGVAGLVPVRGPTLVVHPLRSDLPLDPLDLGSWSVSLGDMELF